MIIILPSFSLALLANGELVINKLKTGSHVPAWSKTRLARRDLIRIWAATTNKKYDKVLAIVTYNGQVLCNAEPTGSKMYDITHAVQVRLNTDAANIKNIHIGGSSVILWAGSSLCVVHSGTKHLHQSVLSCTLSAEIDLVSSNKYYCIIKTTDNRLFALSHTRWGGLCPRTGPPLTFDSKSELAFHDVKGITEIYSKSTYSGCTLILLLMDDNSVYRCRYYGPNYHARVPFTQIQFPVSEVVAKVVSAGSYLVYVTGASDHYGIYIQRKLYENEQPTPVIGEGTLSPVIDLNLVPNLGSYAIVNVLHCSSDSILVQYVVGTTYKMCIMRLPGYIDKSIRVVPMDFFDGITIVSVTNQYKRTCFTADDGSVFWSYNIDAAVPTVTRDTFFDKNQLVAQKTTAHIRSTRSILNEE